MKKLIGVLLAVVSFAANAQTFPVFNLQVQNNATVAGTLGVTGTATLAGNLAVAGAISGPGFSSLVAPYAPLLGANFLGAISATQGTFTSGGVGITAGGLNVHAGGASITGGLVTDSFSASAGATVPTIATGNNSTNAASTQFVARHAPCVSIMDYGGNNIGTATNDTAYQAAIAAIPNSSTAICVYFPPGLYVFGSQAVYNFPSAASSITIEGAGADSTVLDWTAGQGMLFNYQNASNSVHIRDMTLATATTATGSAIKLQQAATSVASGALNTIENVTTRGADGYFGTDYWSFGILITGVSNVNMSGLTLVGPGTPAGNGIFIQGNGSVAAIIYNITNSLIEQFNDGITYGNFVQGVQINTVNLTNNNAGILVPAGLSALDQLTVVGSQLNNIQFNIVLSTAIANVVIADNVFLIDNSSHGIDIALASTTVISGNTFEPNSGSPSAVIGVDVIGHSVAGTILTGNNFFNLTTAVLLGASSSGVNVQSNVYQACSANVTNNAGGANVVGGGSP